MYPPSSTALMRRNLDAIRARIEAARARSPRAADETELLVVTKQAPVALFPALAEAGVTAVGENRLPSAAERHAESPASWVWHGIGHLQRNKAALAVSTFDVFHALDSERLAARLEDVLAEIDRIWPVYVQVNAAQDPAKGGLEPAAVGSFLAGLAAGCPHLDVRGFMTMARVGASEDDVRATFRTLRDVRDEAVRRGVGVTVPSGLSMGMTGDFDLAVEEGSTVVRVGRAVFADVSMDGAGTHRSQEEERA